MAIGIVLGVFGLGFFCWLLFTLAVYALPFLAGLSAGLAAFHSGSGFMGALVVGLLVGVTILMLGRAVLSTVRTPLIRLSCWSTRCRRLSPAISYASHLPASAGRPEAGTSPSPPLAPL
jgi:hypothetical protein